MTTLMNFRSLAFASALLTGSAALSQAVIITTIDDGYVRDGQADTVQGGGISEDLRVRSDNSPNNDNVRKAYLKFDLTGLNADLSAEATFTATISYRSANQNGNRTFYFYGLNSGFTPTGNELGTDWDQTALTWNNAPGNDRTTNVDTGFDASTTTLIEAFGNQYNSDVGKVYTVTIASLGDFVQADNTVTLMISWSDTTEYGFGSRENPTTAYQPTLEFTTVPEPSDFALIAAAMGGAVILLRRRRS